MKHTHAERAHAERANVARIQRTVEQLMSTERRCAKCGVSGTPHAVHVRTINGNDSFTAACRRCYGTNLVTRTERTGLSLEAVRTRMSEVEAQRPTIEKVRQRLREIEGMPK